MLVGAEPIVYNDDDDSDDHSFIHSFVIYYARWQHNIIYR